MLLGMKWTGWHRTAWSAAGRGSIFGRRSSRRAFRVTMTVAPVSARMASQRSVAPIRVVTRKIASRPRAKATLWRMLATVARDRDRDVADTGQPPQGSFDFGDATWTVHTVHPVAQTLPAGAVHRIQGRAVLHHPLHPCRSGSCLRPSSTMHPPATGGSRPNCRKLRNFPDPAVRVPAAGASRPF